MRLGASLFTALLLAQGCLSISTNITFVMGQISLLPKCPMECLMKSIPETDCSLTNTTCICTSAKLNHLVSSCSLANCTIVESFILSNITANVCEPPFESRAALTQSVNIATGVLARLVITLRLISRLWIQHRWFADDWAIFAALLIESACLYFRVDLVKKGLGLHIWDVDLNKLSGLLRSMYGAEIVYVTVNGLVKVSIVCFYLQLFPSKRFKLAARITLAFCICSTVAFILVSMFQCTPVNYAWNKSIAGHCVNYNAVTWAHGALNVVQELIIIALPIGQLRQLNLSRSKKIGLIAVFSVGTFACLTAIIRLYTLRHYGITSDPTWDNVDGVIWSSLEITAGMICASAPALRAGFIRLESKANTYFSSVKSSKFGSDASTAAGTEKDGKVKHSRSTSGMVDLEDGNRGRGIPMVDRSSSAEETKVLTSTSKERSYVGVHDDACSLGEDEGSLNLR